MATRGSGSPAKKRAPKAKAKPASAEKGAFRVAVRCRPLLPHERGQEAVLDLSKGAVTITNQADADGVASESPRHPSPRRERPAGATVRSFAFDHVYDEFVTQEEVYAQFVAPFTAQFLSGYNVTLFAYGQTGTGKTHTVIGGDGYDQRGVVPRFVEDVFAHVASEEARVAEESAAGKCAAARVLNEVEAAEARPILVETSIESVGVTILEVYEGKVHDLLRAGAPSEPREGDDAGGGGRGKRSAAQPREHGAILQLGETRFFG